MPVLAYIPDGNKNESFELAIICTRLPGSLLHLWTHLLQEIVPKIGELGSRDPLGGDESPRGRIEGSVLYLFMDKDPIEGLF